MYYLLKCQAVGWDRCKVSQTFAETLTVTLAGMEHSMPIGAAFV